MDYIDHMQAETRRRYDALFDGVKEVVVVDYPDHPNVGDSAIALGQSAYFASRDISVAAVYCIGTLQRSALRSKRPVVLTGGGNIAGFFDQIDQHRWRVARDLRSSTTLIQAPQSVHFVTAQAEEEFRRTFAARPGLRMAVRDAAAVEAIKGTIPDVHLAPDAVHNLGLIPAPDAVQDTVVLARRDRESGATPPGSGSGVDWLKDEKALRRRTWLRWKARFMGPLGGLLNPSPAGWHRIAEQRLDRGVRLLSQGETVVTDRLHAMLIGLQMGRRVVAIDNNNQKLSKYAATWFADSNPRVQFAPDFDTALELACA